MRSLFLILATMSVLLLSVSCTHQLENSTGAISNSSSNGEAPILIPTPTPQGASPTPIPTPDPSPQHAAGIFRLAGDGQVLLNSVVMVDAMTVGVWNNQGIPVSNASVTWTTVVGDTYFGLKDPNDPVQHTTTSSLTDSNGQTIMYGVGYRNLGQSLAPISVKAEIVMDGQTSSTFFTQTVVPPVLDIGNNYPNVSVVVPVSGSIVIKAGQVIQNAIIMNVIFENAQVPNVGVQLYPDLNVNPDTTLTAHCVGDMVYTDAEGVASCDLAVGNQTGSAVFNIRTGGFNDHPINITVVP